MSATDFGSPPELVPKSELFTEWIERGANVRDEPGHPFFPERELNFRVMARDKAGNTVDFRVPFKVFEIGWKARCLAFRQKRLR